MCRALGNRWWYEYGTNDEGRGRRKANIYSSPSDRRAYGTISAVHGSNLMMQNDNPLSLFSASCWHGRCVSLP